MVLAGLKDEAVSKAIQIAECGSYAILTLTFYVFQAEVANNLKAALLGVQFDLKKESFGMQAMVAQEGAEPSITPPESTTADADGYAPAVCYADAGRKACYQ